MTSGRSADGPRGRPSSRARNSRGRQGRARTSITEAVVLAVACGFLVWGAYRVFVWTQLGQRIDSASMLGAHLGYQYVSGAANRILDFLSVATVVLAATVVFAIAAVRRRPGVAVAAVVVVGGSLLTTELLKQNVFSRPSYGITDPLANSLPSGHVTTAAAITVAVLLAVGPKIRPIIALVGGLYTAATGLSTVVMSWHHVSDVVAAIGVVGAWTGLVVFIGAVARTARHRSHAPIAVNTARVVPRTPPTSATGYYYRAARAIFFTLGVIGLVVAAVIAWRFRTSLPRGPLTVPGQLSHNLQTQGYVFSITAVTAFSLLLPTACLYLLRPGE